jgi:hypothetical protein
VSGRVAARKIGCSYSSLNTVCRGHGRRTLCGGFMWKPKTENYPLKIDLYVSANVRRCRTVLQYDLDGNLIAKHAGTVEAAKTVGGKSKAISGACRGIQKTAYGFVWKYE